MQPFFDPQHLTDAERARWPDAIAQYHQIIRRNFEREIAAMSSEEYDRSLALCRLTTPHDTRPLSDHLVQIHLALHGGPGDPKSALFARLLSGKPPLPNPPPTSFAYPWYDVIEAPGPFSVAIAPHYRRADDDGNALPLPEMPTHVLINQCPWAIVRANPAASRLFALERQLIATGIINPGRQHPEYRWTREFLEDVKAAYREGPVMTVKYREWAEYRVQLGRRDCHAQRGDLQSLIDRLETSPETALKNLKSVFDIWRLYFNVAIGETLLAGEHPQVRLDRMKATTGLNCNFTALFAQAQTTGLAEDIKRYNADPAQFDTVNMSFDDWVLEKTMITRPAPGAQTTN